MTTVTLKKFLTFTFLLSFSCLPLTGCGPSTEPVGVEDDSLEEAMELQETEEYISGEPQ